MGENTIAIAVINADGSGGLGDGVALKLLKKSEATACQRNVFNGLAQVIVQSTPDAGELKLTATADGLTPASVTIQSK